MNCSICNLPNSRRRAAIDRHLLQGRSIRSTAHKFGVGEDSLGRHKRHLSQAIVQAAESAPDTRDDYGAQLLAEIGALKADALRLQKQAEVRRDLRVAIRCFDSRLRTLEVQARMVGVLETTSKSVNVNFDVDMRVTPEMANRIISAYLATRPPASLPAIEAPAPVPENGAAKPQDAPEQEGPCIPIKSNGKIN